MTTLKIEISVADKHAAMALMGTITNAIDLNTISADQDGLFYYLCAGSKAHRYQVGTAIIEE